MSNIVAVMDLTPATDFDVIAFGAAATSKITERMNFALADSFSLNLTGTSPTAKVQYEYSIDGTNFSDKDDEDDLVSDTNVTWSNNPSGTNAILIALVPAPFYRFVLTNLSGANAVAAVLKLHFSETPVAAGRGGI